jgi:hypothetical protein
MVVSDDEHDFGEDDDAQPEADGEVVDGLEAVDAEGFRLAGDDRKCIRWPTGCAFQVA